MTRLFTCHHTITNKEVFKYEQCSHPPALFDTPTLLRKADKPQYALDYWSSHLSQYFMFKFWLNEILWTFFSLNFSHFCKNQQKTAKFSTVHLRLTTFSRKSYIVHLFMRKRNFYLEQNLFSKFQPFLQKLTKKSANFYLINCGLKFSIESYTLRIFTW